MMTAVPLHLGRIKAERQESAAHAGPADEPLSAEAAAAPTIAARPGLAADDLR